MVRSGQGMCVLQYFGHVALSILLFYFAGFAIFTTLEVLAPKGQMSIRDRTRGLIFLAAFVPIDAATVVLVDQLSNAIGLRPLPVLRPDIGSAILATAIGAVWIDFTFYWFHRAQHAFLWRWHAVHHSIEQLSAINSYHHWTEGLWRTLLVGLPLLVINFAPAPQLAALLFAFRLQIFLIHSPTRLHIGPLAFALVDNRYHRIHHSLEPRHRDRYFAAMTPLWDWLFGTIYRPAKGEWPAVGLAEMREPKTIREWSSLPWRLGRDRLAHVPGSVSDVPAVLPKAKASIDAQTDAA